MNFGTIKDTYAKILIDSYINESKKEKLTYKKFIKLLSESEILKTQFVVYKNIENGYFSSEVSAVEYLKENISLFDKFKKEIIIKENNNLQKTLGKRKLVETKNLHVALNNLITLEKNVNTIKTLTESFEIVKNWLVTPKKIEEVKKEKNNVDVDRFLEIVTKKYNDKYSNISEEEKKIVKAILSEKSKEKEITLEEIKQETIDLLSKSIKEHNNNLEVKVRLLEVKDVLYNTKFNLETFKEDILKIYDLKNSL
jgi:hypothetical protein